jgi:predicted DsbA family dithiol-disulfide isomerase
MKIRITHFSDVLCIWAYITQARVAELRSNFAEDVVFDYRYFNVFGDVETKMASQWNERGGLAGYAAHVEETAARFDHIRLDPGLWRKNPPTSSMPAHLVLCAARRVEEHASGSGRPLALDREIRRSFFEEGVDISRTSVLLEICTQQGIDVAAVEARLADGSAHAALATDLRQATELGIRASPTLTFNEGRQILTGNVGYRVIEANVRELLRHPGDEQSWC